MLPSHRQNGTTTVTGRIGSLTAWLERCLRRLSPRLVVAILALATLGIGLRFGIFVAGGADSYAYLSQAKLWMSGVPRVSQPWVQALSWPSRELSTAPLGYQPISHDGTIVPTTAPGLPLLMAGFEWIFGANGPFIVVPALGALAVWFTYLLGRDVTRSPLVGMTAASLLVASPVFLSYLLQPMTDVPVAAGWTLVGVLALREPWPRSFSAGLVAGATLLIRPNLFALAMVPPVAWAWPCLRGSGEWRLCLRDSTVFVAGLVPGVLAIAVINDRLYGSPWVSGYGALGDLYSFGGLATNLRNYATWLILAETPLILLSALPLMMPGSLRDDGQRSSARAGLSALVIFTLASYIFYRPFDAWFYLRFLLPAFPPLFILTAAGIKLVALRLPSSARAAVAVVLGVVLVAYSVTAGLSWGIFGQRASEQRYVDAARYAARFTPSNAVFIATQHSGSLRYYANRKTVRWEYLPEDRLDFAIRELEEVGYRPYILLDHTEEPGFVARFAARNAAGNLDWPPIADIKGTTNVRIYDPDDRLAAAELRRPR
jgi:hypothetical protein